MKRLKWILTLLVMFFGTFVVQARYVDYMEAIDFVKEKFANDDVDIYIEDQTSPVGPVYISQWNFLIDLHPLAGWPHQAALFSVKTFPSMTFSGFEYSQTEIEMPPKGKYVPVVVKNRYGLTGNPKPVVAKNTQTNGGDEIAERTYALIISGGIEPESNHERYWNDCSFIYQTLRNRYCVPKSNIFPIMSDGNNPNLDMNVGKMEYVSQPLDLDFDSVDDIYLSASKINIETVLGNLSLKLKEDDHLFVFVIDHGGWDPERGKSFISLWNFEKLYSDELAELLKPFSENFVNINVVLGQCNSGGFIADLKMNGCVVSTACKFDQYSYSCVDKPFDEFVYQWTCAVNGADFMGNPLYSDEDCNGIVTMDEAFGYASANDRRRESPQYSSVPLSVGEDLGFDHLASAVDLYIKDWTGDTGKEPDNAITNFWNSPAIWTRNDHLPIREHQNPYYSIDHTTASIFVEVHNRGKKKYVPFSDPKEQASKGWYLHNYWAKASTGLTAYDWVGKIMRDPDGMITGEHLRAHPIPSLESGDSVLIKINWGLPEDILEREEYKNEDHHYCLLGRIFKGMDDDYPEKYNFYYDVLKSNKVAQKNLSLISRMNLSRGTRVYISGMPDKSETYSLELRPTAKPDEQFYKYGVAEISLNSTIADAWKDGGCQGQDISVPDSSNPYKIMLKSKYSDLRAITLDSNQTGTVSLKFNFNKVGFDYQSYSFDLIQRDSQGKIVGGETFLIEPPKVSVNPFPIEVEEVSDSGKYVISPVSQNLSQVTWINDKDEIIGFGKILTLPQTDKEQSVSIAALTEEGTLEVGDAVIPAKKYIDFVSKISDGIDVNFITETVDGGHIEVYAQSSGLFLWEGDVESGVKAVHIRLPGTISETIVVKYVLNSKYSQTVIVL